MSWFDVYRNEISASSGNYELVLKKIPMKRVISISDINNNIAAGEQIYVDLLDKSVNKYINSSLQNVTDDYSYVVILEDYVDLNISIPVKSRVVDNILYFIAQEEILKDVDTTRYYAVYYGLTSVKNIDLVYTTLNSVPVSVWEIVETDPPTQGLYYDIASSSINYYTKSITNATSGSYTLALYNDGADWESSISKKIGAKAFGVFDGPRIKIIGSKGKQYGKFQIRIFPYNDNGDISIYPILDWTKVDCYSENDLNDEILFSKIDLEYKKYFFEIETIAEKNIMAITNSVKIDKYEFTPNYGLTYNTEEINPNLAFVTIAGIR